MAKTLQKITDQTTISIIGVYLVQKLGQPTLDEILETATNKLDVEIEREDIKRALKGASRAGRDYISILSAREGKKTVTVYSLKDANRWRTAPEYAHIGDLLPQLLSTPELAAIKGWFDDKEKKPLDTKGAKQQRGVLIGGYQNYCVRVRTTDWLVGSQINCEATDYIRESLPAGLLVDGEVEGIFIWESDGSVIIPTDVMSAWWKSNANRYMDIPEARGEWVAFAPVRIYPNQDSVKQLVIPVNGPGRPSAPKAHEILLAGQEFEIHFSAPSKGYLTSDQIETLFIMAGLRPRRGLSPARGKRYGRFVVLEFKCLGAVKTSGLDPFLAQLPADQMNDYLRDAAKRLRSVDLTGLQSEEEDTVPFPGGNGHGETVVEA